MTGSYHRRALDRGPRKAFHARLETTKADSKRVSSLRGRSYRGMGLRDGTMRQRHGYSGSLQVDGQEDCMAVARLRG